MLKEVPFEYTPDQISQFAKNNVRWLALAAISYCRDHHTSSTAFWYETGHKFAGAWDWVKTTDDLVFGIIGNLLSMGFELLDVRGDGYEYTVEVIGWPSEQELDYFELSRIEAEALWEIFLPITDYLAHDFTWKRDNDKVTFTVIRR